MSLKHYAGPALSRTASPGAWAYANAARAARRGNLPPASGPATVTTAAVANMRKQLGHSGGKVEAPNGAAAAVNSMRTLISRADAA